MDYRVLREMFDRTTASILLRKPISDLISTDSGSYIEPFAVGGWILFYKEKWAKNEVYNDLDNRLYTLFSILKFVAKIIKYF